MEWNVASCFEGPAYHVDVQPLNFPNCMTKRTGFCKGRELSRVYGPALECGRSQNKEAEPSECRSNASPFPTHNKLSPHCLYPTWLDARKFLI